jgi:phospholipase A1
VFANSAYTQSLLTEKPSYETLSIQFPSLIWPANKLVSAHTPNYILPLHYIAQSKAKNYPQYFAAKTAIDKLENTLENTEVAFQISGKLLLANLNNISFYTAYTQQSYWQFYAKSAFFRATDYKPQIFAHIPLSFLSAPTESSLRIGYVHQSNGRGSAKERSWNRIYSSLKFNVGNSALLLKLWHIQHDSQLHYNEDIGDYLGCGKIGFTYYFQKDHYITLQKRLSAIDLWTTGEFAYLFPILPFAQGVIKGFAGYGENLMTYDFYTTSFSIGIALRFI